MHALYSRFMRIIILFSLIILAQVAISQNIILSRGIPKNLQLVADQPDFFRLKNSVSAPLTDIDSLLRFSFNYLGTPYRYGGNSVKGFDCSGFVSYVYRHFGFELPHSSREQQRLGFALPIDSVQKGDLLFFKGRNLQNGATGHVSIVVDVSHDKGIQMIHSTKSGLRLDWLSEAPYYKKRFIAARRIIRSQSRLALNQ